MEEKKELDPGVVDFYQYVSGKHESSPVVYRDFARYIRMRTTPKNDEDARALTISVIEMMGNGVFYFKKMDDGKHKRCILAVTLGRAKIEEEYQKDRSKLISFMGVGNKTQKSCMDSFQNLWNYIRYAALPQNIFDALTMDPKQQQQQHDALYEELFGTTQRPMEVDPKRYMGNDPNYVDKRDCDFGYSPLLPTMSSAFVEMKEAGLSQKERKKQRRRQMRK